MYRCTQCGNLESLDNDEQYKACRISHGEPCHACEQLERLNAQICDAKNMLEELLNQRRALKTQANELHSVIHQTPPEVTSYIFEFYVDDRDPSHSSGTHAPSPFILGAVCQGWRTIVWSTPPLWTSISLTLDPTCLDFNLPAQWIHLSGELPLSIHLDITPIPNHSYIRFYPLIDLINQCSGRWKSLDFSLPSSLLGRFRCDPSLGAPLLKEIRFHNQSARDDKKISLGATKTCPSVINISKIAPRSLNVEWNCVTRVCLIGTCVEESLELFRRAPQMTECTLVYTGATTSDDLFPTSGTLHSKVESLHVTCGFSGDMGLFFDNLTLPALSDITCIMRRTRPPFDALESFFRRSSLCLQRMELSGARFSEDDGLIRILILTPSVKCLSLSSYRPTSFDEFFRALDPKEITPPEGHFLPLLETLIVIGPTLAWNLIPRFCFPLNSKRDGPRRPLRSILVRGLDAPRKPAPFLDADIMPVILQLMDERIDIKLQYQLGDSETVMDMINSPSNDIQG